MAEAAFLHQALEILLAGVHADGLGQIAVAGVIARHELAHGRKNLEGIPVVGLLQGLGHLGELQHQQLAAGAQDTRSEEHTSELQSQSNLVCRLLLEKKKKNKK